MKKNSGKKSNSSQLGGNCEENQIKFAYFGYFANIIGVNVFSGN
jgi:hypothetical protein